MKLYYTGFNGYLQLPGISNKIIDNFVLVNDIIAPIAVSSHYDSLVIKQKDAFTLLHTDDNGTSKEMALKFMEEPHCFLCTSDFIYTTHKCEIWKSETSTSPNTWSKLVLNIHNDNALPWNQEDSIVKIVHVIKIGLILLLSNGSVWKATETGVVRSVYAPHVDEATDIAASLEHVIILTKSGCLLTFGLGSHGLLGCGDLSSVDLPVQVPSFDGLVVKKVSAGGYHSCAVTDTGDLYVWGWNTNGQLGIEESGITALPQPVELDVDVVDVACGTRHTVIHAGGNLYSTGWNEYGQLGFHVSRKQVDKFTKVDFDLTHIKELQLVCGPWATMLLTD